MPLPQSFDPAVVAEALLPIDAAIDALYKIPASNSAARAAQVAAIEVLRQNFIDTYGVVSYWIASGVIYRPR